MLQLLLSDPLPGAIATVLLAVLFGGSLTHKLMRFDQFIEALDGYALLAPVLQKPFAGLLILAEAAAVLLLVSPATRAVAGMLMLLLLFLYTGAISVNLLRGNRWLDCGCGWGAVRAGDIAGISGWLVLRNAAVALCTLALLMPASSRPMMLADWILVLVGSAAATMLYLLADRLIDNWHRLAALGIR